MNNKNKGNRNFLNTQIRKTAYRVRTRSMRGVIAMALVVGILAAVCHGVWGFCSVKESSYAQISVVYPEIADGKYPDGSRFSAYDLISEERLQGVLEAMQKDGKYLDYTVEQLEKQFDLYTYTQGSVAEDVSTLRSEGNNYSYFANEYRLTFTQPVEGADHSAELLERLIQAEIDSIHAKFGGEETITVMADLGDVSLRDYNEQTGIYRTRIGVILRYLKTLNNKAGGFVSASTGKNMMELISRYEVLQNERLSQIQSFVEVSGLTKDKASLLNSLKNNEANAELQNKKFSDESEINGYAVENYDNTFTENLIVVSTSDQVGLYQARPKTVFDEVMDRYNLSVENTINTQGKIDELNHLMSLYSAESLEDTEESVRLVAKCEKMIEELEKDYNELTKVTAQTVEDYLAEINANYITYKIEADKSVIVEILVGAAMTGAAVAILAFVLYAIVTVIFDVMKVCVKKGKLRRMRTYRNKLNVAE